MDFKWGCLGRDKTRELESSDNDKNLKHCRRSWVEVVKVSVEAHNTFKPVPASSMKSDRIDPKATYTGEHVTAILARSPIPMVLSIVKRKRVGRKLKCNQEDRREEIGRHSHPNQPERGKCPPQEVIMARSVGHVASKAISRTNVHSSSAVSARCLDI